MMKNIVLIGLMGSGKSTIGRELSRRLHLPFVDMDDYIEKKEGKTVRQIFSEEGEAYFRNAETQAAKELAARGGHIIATGGGTVLTPRNMEYLKENSVVVFLDRSPKDILKKIDIESRPLLAADKNRLYTLEKERRPLYEKYADITLTGSHGVALSLLKVMRRLRPYVATRQKRPEKV